MVSKFNKKGNSIPKVVNEVIWDNCLKNSRRVFVVQRRRRLPRDVVGFGVRLDLAGNDELEGEAWLVEAGVRWEVIQLDVHLNKEDKLGLIFSV